ncbi:molybdopterin-guanine dinucleotide biosynthesis protein B [Lichenicoccus roseus]|uniref:molybdopterin-guanine dinucleotide biosynthesis protein B n=1 Tax=Lichenicoccus roseus TaxID=2683649 RepID=UPI001F0E232E|nr:molybdopterin-guanine dinucleotide biosynthesis protein B [Lichenicoccus roseus]
MLGIVGRSGSGKTTLITALLERFTGQGLLVSTVKHTHHAVDLDQPGKDSFRHREAGAHEVMLVGDARWALLHERRSRPAAGGPGQDELAEVLRRLAPVDLVLVEGFARTLGPRIEVVREAIASGAGKTPLWPDDPGVEAVASDVRPAGFGRSWLPLDDPGAIAGWIVQRFGLDIGRPCAMRDSNELPH